MSQAENSPTEKKQIEDLLSQLKAKLASLENEEQQKQTREIEAEDELREALRYDPDYPGARNRLQALRTR